MKISLNNSNISVFNNKIRLKANKKEKNFKLYTTKHKKLLKIQPKY